MPLSFFFLTPYFLLDNIIHETVPILAVFVHTRFLRLSYSSLGTLIVRLISAFFAATSSSSVNHSSLLAWQQDETEESDLVAVVPPTAIVTCCHGSRTKTIGANFEFGTSRLVKIRGHVFFFRYGGRRPE